MLQGNDQVAAGGLYFWDQLTAALLVDQTLATSSTRSIEVVLSEDRTETGVTVETAAGSEVTVIDTVDVGRFETHFLSAIAGEDVGPIVIDPDWYGSYDGTEWTVDLPESLQVGRYSVQIENTGDKDAGFVVGYLTDGATVQDIIDWESREQPPFYEVTGFIFRHARLILSLDSRDRRARHLRFCRVSKTQTLLPEILTSYEVTEIIRQLRTYAGLGSKSLSQPM